MSDEGAECVRCQISCKVVVVSALCSFGKTDVAATELSKIKRMDVF